MEKTLEYFPSDKYFLTYSANFIDIPKHLAAANLI